MATGTLDLSLVEAERRRREAEAGEHGAGTAVDDLDRDAAERAHRIVSEVLAAARAADAATASLGVASPVEAVATPSTTGARPTPHDDDDAAIWARFIVDEVTASAAVAEAAAAAAAPAVDAEPDTHTETPGPVVVAPTADDGSASAAPRPADVAPPSAPLERADLVLLAGDHPIALLPGVAYDPVPGAWAPTVDALPRLVEQALSPITQARRSMTDAIRDAADSPEMPGARWLIVGALWAAAAAAAIPLAVAALGSAVDLEIDLWGGEPATVVVDAPVAADVDTP